MAGTPSAPQRMHGGEAEREPGSAFGEPRQHIAEVVGAQVDSAQCHQRDEEERQQPDQNPAAPRVDPRDDDGGQQPYSNVAAATWPLGKL